MKKPFEIIRENLRLHCQINDITQQQIADECGVSKACVSMWFSGKINIGQEHFDRISIITGIPLPALFIEKSALNWRRSLRGLLRRVG